eukprot:3783339-Prorocentrum_lima.AAC.1
MPGHSSGHPERRRVCKALCQPVHEDSDQLIVHQVEQHGVREQARHELHLHTPAVAGVLRDVCQGKAWRWRQPVALGIPQPR